MPARVRTEIERFQDIPNIGPAMEGDLIRLGVKSPRALAKADPVRLYNRLGGMDGRPHDPCVLDAFLAAVDYMNGAPARNWWKYTPKRKRMLAERRS